ncbi:PIN domain-containing protein [Planococcus salinus]|uniref:PIN domain-containing protein n=1 Tax=Planococcus salinus TaxID=1848460 RepID=A0A3M8P7F9_9BACL|nr:PIN domain-containing protein [Planococcus salinus]RNF39615.1 PIN domain-containing protein [Planococcus salinus]
MNSIYDSPAIPKVFIDTTILCGALRTDGINRKILQAARFPNLYQPVFSKVCLFEFVRNAANGLGKGDKRVRYGADDIEEFFQEFLNPIFEHYEHLPVNSVLGRYSVETIIREHLPLGDVLVELSGCDYNTAKTIAKKQEMAEPLSNFDQDDVHVWVTAIQENCDIILTSNIKRFPSEIGKYTTH